MMNSNLEKPKIEIIYPKKFEPGQRIKFIITESKNLVYQYDGMIHKTCNGYYISLGEDDNDAIFTCLNIERSTFYQKILGVNYILGSWPFTEDLNQLKLIVKGLEHYNEM